MTSRRALGGLVAAMASTLALAASPPAPADGLRADPAQVLAGTPRNLAVTMMPGETYVGPGPITVAYLGAKKQLLVPNGRWVLLALGDQPSRHKVPVNLVNMVFGQFQQGQLRSLLSYVFNGRAVGAKIGWADVERCQQVDLPAPQKLTLQTDSANLCGHVARIRQWKAPTSDAWERALAALARLGTAVPEGQLADSFAVAAGAQGDVVFMRRLDFTGPATDAPARMVWLRPYAEQMLLGLQRKITADELEAGTALAAHAPALPD